MHFLKIKTAFIVICILMIVYILSATLEKHYNNASNHYQRTCSYINLHTDVAKYYAAPLMIHSICSEEPGRFVLFSNSRYGARNTFTNCTIDGENIPGHVLAEGMFECFTERDFHIDENAILSIRHSSLNIALSTAKWKYRFGLNPKECNYKDLCIVTTVKNESRTISEWIEYHIRQGVELFVIYDNGSTDKTRQILKGYTEVIVLDWPWQKTQRQTFVHGAFYVKYICEWALFIDVDEFAFPVAHGLFNTSLKNMILNFPMWLSEKDQMVQPLSVAQVCFDSKDMGPSGHLKCPNLNVSEAYLQFVKWRYFGKCAVKPMKVFPKTTIHKFTVKGNTVTLPRKSGYLIHYRYQCWESFEEKLYKGRASGRVADWTRKDIMRMRKLWFKDPGPSDTLFRNYKRKLLQ